MFAKNGHISSFLSIFYLQKSDDDDDDDESKFPKLTNV
jgi:hypothetical protein